MHQVQLDPRALNGLASCTAIITGGAGGIGAATARIYNEHHANVVIADLPHFEEEARRLIASFPHPSKALFIAANILDWEQMNQLFRKTIHSFGSLDIVVANAGIMESNEVLDMDDVDSEGNLRESNEAFKVIDVNIKGTLNTLRLAMHYLISSPRSHPAVQPCIILVSSTSGYFGGTGVSGYITSKHGVIGLLRGSQVAARRYGIAVKAIAPFYTPTRITAGFADTGMEGNSPESVGRAIACTSVDDTKSGSSILVAGEFLRELEFTRNDIMSDWLGIDMVQFMHRSFEFITKLGGYRLPKNTSTNGTSTNGATTNGVTSNGTNTNV